MTTTKSSSSWIYYGVVPPLYVCWRVYMANRMPISDCDEVYNYWEPLHFVLYGSGLQTWEYAHEYALHYPVPRDKVAVFVLLRSMLGAFSAVSELAFLHALSAHVSSTVVLWTGLVLLFSAGMNHAAAAYLPSATWMIAWMLASALFLSKRHNWFVLVAVTVTLTTGWPFGVVMLIPLGISVLWKDYFANQLIYTLMVAVACTVVVQGLTMVVDHAHYGVWLSPTLNIFTYNAGAGGDELYGVEPASFYVKNLLLNLNLVAPLGLLALPLGLLTGWQKYGNILVILSSLVLWLAITVPRPHKEERFMFPIYPLLIFGAVFSVECLLDVLSRVIQRLGSGNMQGPHTYTRSIVHALVWIPIILIALCRTAALSKYYSAPLAVYASLGQQGTSAGGDQSLVCTCGEWYRYPGTFYLPQGTQLAFLPSSFHGQLPQPFSEYGSQPESQAVLQPFNDRNLEQPQRYEPDPSNCKWIVDLDGSECADSISKHLIASIPFLDAQGTSSLHRVLYIPYLHEKAIADRRVRYHKYALYQVDKKVEDPQEP